MRHVIWENFRFYLRSPSTLYGYCAGSLMYLTYATAYRAWLSPGLIGLSVFIGGFIPFYSRLSNRVDEVTSLKTARVSDGRLCRFVMQLLMNLFIFASLVRTGVVHGANLGAIGGLLGAAFLTTGASQGIQYFGLALANRDIGEKNRNILISLSINILITALATMGLGWARMLFIVSGVGFGSIVFGVGIASDLRAILAPRGGVGVFFGTFNPFHLTHLQIIESAIRERGLRKVYVHSTVVPKLHEQALARNEIRIARIEGGMRVYEKTKRADVHMNYFPTGNRFFEFETRKTMIEMSIADSPLASKIEVLSMPEEYARNGFYGILRAIGLRHRGERLHGIHGSDIGGMWIRSIYDESGWIYPYPVRRTNGVSATAIRNGAVEMASPAIRALLLNLRGQNQCTPGPLRLECARSLPKIRTYNLSDEVKKNVEHAQS